MTWTIAEVTMWVLLPVLLAATSPADAILGRWEGTSTCIKASWNAACHDEVVRYDFEADSAHADTIHCHGYKKVNDEWQWMGDLDFHYEAARRRWVGEYSNSRVHIEWSYWLVKGGLAGKWITLPDRRKGRDVIARRPVSAR